jgi:hypothetical protein
VIKGWVTGDLEEKLRIRAKLVGIENSIDAEMQIIAQELVSAAAMRVMATNEYASSGKLASGLRYEITRSPDKITIIFLDTAIYAGVQDYGSFQTVIVPEHFRNQKRVFGKYIEGGPKAVIIRSYARNQNIPAKHFMERAISGLPTVKSRIIHVAVGETE